MRDLKKEIQKGYNTFKVFEHLNETIQDLTKVENAIVEKRKRLDDLKSEISECHEALEKQKDGLKEARKEARGVSDDAQEEASVLLATARREAHAIVDDAKKKASDIGAKSKEAEAKLSDVNDKIVTSTKKLVDIQKKISDTAEKLNSAVSA